MWHEGGLKFDEEDLKLSGCALSHLRTYRDWQLMLGRGPKKKYARPIFIRRKTRPD